MNFRKYAKPVIFVTSLLSMAALFSRCTASTSGSGTSATTYSISGTISTGATAASVSAQKIGATQAAAMSTNDVSAQATLCSDGYYYNVYCVSYSEPPTAATGAVTCGGASSGSFTVAGLPLNAEIGCFVRRSSDDTTYTTLGTIEIPTTSLSGGTTSIVSQGDLQLAISLNTDGSITTEVTGGGSNVASPIATVDASQYSGFWLLNCDTAATGELVDPVKCKCQNGGQEKYTGMDKEAACRADNASLVLPADTQQYVEIKMYKATPASDMTVDDGVIITAGTAVPVISVWSASSSTDSSRGTGGEGASSTVKNKNGTDVNLTWDPTLATTAIEWASGVQTLGNGVSVDLTTANGAAPMPTGTTTTAGAWKNWVAALYSNATGFTCTWGASGVNDAGCLAEFSEMVLRENRSVNLPSVHIERTCDNNGCDAVVANARIFVDGFHVNYSGVSPASIDTTSVNLDGVSPRVRNRFVFEPFAVTPSGGGFTQHDFRNRGYSCKTAAAPGSADVTNEACNGADGNFINCGIREETAIHFKPSSSTAMKIFFEQRSNVVFASLQKWNGGTPSNGSFTDAMTICTAQISASEGRFQMTAAKQ